MKLIDLINAINSYGTARETGDTGLIKLSAHVLHQMFSTLPDDLPLRGSTKPDAEAAAIEK